MRGVLRWTGIAAAAFVFVFVAILTLFDWNWFKGIVEQQVSAGIGREFTIAGNLDVDLGLVPTIRLEDVRLANPRWANAEHMARIAAVEFSVDLRELFDGRIVLPHLSVTKPTVLLIQSTEGEANWAFEQGTSEEEKEAAGEQFVRVGRISLAGGRLVYRDLAEKTELVRNLSIERGHLRLQQGKGQPLTIDAVAQGRIEDRPLVVTATAGGSGKDVRPGDYTIEGRIRLGNTRLTLDAALAEPAQWETAEGALRVSGPDIAEPLGVFGIELPHSPAFWLSGRAMNRGSVWRMDDLKLVLGRSILEGEVAFEARRERPFVRANLLTQKLDVAQLTQLTEKVGGQDDSNSSEEQANEVPAESAGTDDATDVPLNLDILSKIDLDLTFDARDIAYGSRTIKDLHAELMLEEGRLVLEPFRAKTLDGSLNGRLMVDAGGNVPSISASFSLDEVPLGPLLPKGEFPLKTTGEASGRVKFEGKGATLKQLLADGEGRIAITVPEVQLSGRTFAIAGGLSADVSLTPRVRAEAIRLGNFETGSTANMVEIASLELTIDIPELLRGRVVLPEFTIERPQIVLEKDEGGRANWQFGGQSVPEREAAEEPVAEEAVPEQREEFPIIGKLSVSGGRLVYRDPTEALEITSKFSEVLGAGKEGESKVSLEGEGRLEGRPFTLAATAGSLKRLRDEDVPYPIDIKAAVGKTKLAVEGTVMQPLAVKDIDLRLAASGPNMAELFPIFGIPLPPTPPYKLSGEMARKGSTWIVKNLDGRVGDSDLMGNLRVETAGERPSLEATLASTRLDFDDLAGFIGAEPSTGKGETASAEQEREARQEAKDRRLLPDTPVNLERLRAMDMNVSFKGKEIVAPNLPLEQLEVQILLDNGRLSLSPLSFRISNGQLAGDVILDGREQVPAVRVSLDLSRVRLRPFFEGTGFAAEASGIFGGHVELSGSGRTLAEILASSYGRVAIIETGGSISGLIVELVGLDVAESLLLLVSEDVPVAIRCMVGQFDVTDGTLKTDAFVLDTSDSLVTGRARINLGDETMNIRLLAHPKDPSLLDARAPVSINGKFVDPEISIDAAGVAESLALSVVLAPVSAVDELVDLGLGAENQPCLQLIEQAKARAQ